MKSHLRAIYGEEECSMRLRFYQIFQHCCLLTQKLSAIRTLHPLNYSIHSLESFVARWLMTYQSFNCTVSCFCKRGMRVIFAEYAFPRLRFENRISVPGAQRSYGHTPVRTAEIILFYFPKECYH